MIARSDAAWFVGIDLHKDALTACTITAKAREVTRHRNGLSRDHVKTLHRVKSIMNRLNRPGPARMDAAGLQRSLLASIERSETDDLTMLW